MKHFENFIQLSESPPPSTHACKNFCGTPPEKNLKAFQNSSNENDYQFQQYSQNITVEQFTAHV